MLAHRPHSRSRTLTAALALPAVVALAAGCASSLTKASYSESVDAAGEHVGAGAHSPAEPGDTGGTDGAAAPGTQAFAMGKIVNPAGASVGTVTLSDAGGKTLVTVEVKGLPAGYHGLHVHAVGECQPNSPDPADPAKVGDFNSAGGHLAGTGTDHPTHAGDLPALLVGADGTGSLTATTDRLAPDLLADADGSALVIHGGPDNYANIPSRYATAGPDAETKKAGDSGPRIACAVIEKAEAAAAGH